MITYDHIGKNKRASVFIIFLFLLVIIALGWVFSRAYNNPAILIGAVAFSSLSALISYYFSDKITLAISGAKEINLKSHPELYNIIQNLTIAGGLPMPKVYIIEDTAMNAFATGRNPKNAVICYTTGILQRLNKKEIEGVTAHELSHVGNYDIRYMAIVTVLVGTVTLIADWFLRASLFGGKSDRENNNQWMMLIGFALAILSPIIATLLQLAVSRKREFLADASGALLTRYPEGLASALEKISGDREPLEAANKATAHMYFANPLKNRHDGVGWFAGLFNTHPPAQERIKRLREMNM
ncbi:MAG TPA: M48 family metallopeptidase [Patescibacteria group bacterium]|nr:M48 family metallopeptidase [Patescibacteria group bacterium]